MAGTPSTPEAAFQRRLVPPSAAAPPPPPSTPQLDVVIDNSRDSTTLDRIQACVSLASDLRPGYDPRQRTPPPQRPSAQHLQSPSSLGYSHSSGSSSSNHHLPQNVPSSPAALQGPRTSPTNSLSPALSYANANAKTSASASANTKTSNSSGGVSSGRPLRPKPVATAACFDGTSPSTTSAAAFVSATCSLPPRLLMNGSSSRGVRGTHRPGGNLPEVLELPPTISSAPSSPLSGAESQPVARERLGSKGSMVCEVQRTLSCDFGESANHLGPVDNEHLNPRNRAIANRVNKVGVDPLAVYVRLSNFAARRKSLQDRRASNDAAPRPTGSPSCTWLPQSEDSTNGEQLEDQEGTQHSIEIEPISPFFLPKHSSAESAGLGRTASRSSTPTCSHPLYDGEMTSTLSARHRHRGEGLLQRDSGDFSDPEPGPDPEEIERIQSHLEEMNSAAAHLNICQNALHSCETERTDLLQSWTTRSADLSAACGVHRIARARPFFAQRARMEAARAAVEEASREYLDAGQMDASEERQWQLLQEHIARVEDFQIAQKDFAQSQQNIGPTLTVSVKAYFEAEQEFTTNYARIDSDYDQLVAAVAKAKARYHGALRDLEALSEQTHRKRGELGGDQSNSVAKGSPRSRVLHSATMPAASQLERKHSFDSDRSSSLL